MSKVSRINTFKYQLISNRSVWPLPYAVYLSYSKQQLSDSKNNNCIKEGKLLPQISLSRENCPMHCLLYHQQKKILLNISSFYFVSSNGRNPSIKINVRKLEWEVLNRGITVAMATPSLIMSQFCSYPCFSVCFELFWIY